MTTRVMTSRNVNHALAGFIKEAASATPSEWRVISPRGLETVEFKGTWITEYECPRERVLFSPERDANPFFHLMEALWILAGRDDVAFLAHFNANMANFSDDGKVFHAPYGYRLRRHFQRKRSGSVGEFLDGNIECVDQVAEVIDLLTKEPDTRRAVMAIWDPAVDCNVKSKDIPCNDLLMFKLRDGQLDLTVSCRSNDAIWGAYGANAVQFSVLLEFMAQAVGAKVGRYKQISDSMHVYTGNPTWTKLSDHYKNNGVVDYYTQRAVVPYPLMRPYEDWQSWLVQCETFVRGDWSGKPLSPFFLDVAYPMHRAWDSYKAGQKQAALDILQHGCMAFDWRRACMEWIQRRFQS